MLLNMKKILGLFIVLFISFSFYLASANSITFSLGELESQETIYVQDITYNKYVINGAGEDIHVVHNLEIGRYSDFDVVLHDRLYGEDAMGLSTVLNIALDYEAETGKVVYAAVNGDFFSTLPIDFYAVENNILRIGYYNKNAFGFTDAHKSKVGKVTYGYKINIYNDQNEYIDYVHIDQLNDALSTGEIGVYTPDSTSSISGDNIAKLTVSNEAILNNSDFHYRGYVMSDISDFTFNNDAYSILSDELVIAAKGDSESYQKLLDLVEAGNKIEIYPYPIDDWEGMDYIIGGWQILLDRGVKLPEEIHGSPTARHPRTTIGVNRDGEIGLTVVDGRAVNIPGLTLGELADLNEDLGYYTALELDGGGSSTCLLRNLETNELEVMNTPSDGHLRRVVNAVLIVGDPIEDEEPTTTETPTTEIPTTEMTTTTEPTTTPIQTTIPSTITSSETNITSFSTTITTLLEETSLTNDNTEDNTYINQGCSSCNQVNVSLFFFAFMFLISFIAFRKK
jgi:hypothetical protein